MFDSQLDSIIERSVETGEVRMFTNLLKANSFRDGVLETINIWYKRGRTYPLVINGVEIFSANE
jgi:hypothetical protein